MYAGPDIVQAAAPKRAGLFALPAVLATCCLGFLLFLIGATIVVALIPIYLPQQSVATNPRSFRTLPITAMVEAQAAQPNGRRKREQGDLDEYVGGTFESDGLTLASNALRSGFSGSSTVQDASVSSISIVYAGASGRKRRFALSKRQSRPRVFLVMTFQLIYSFSCARSCQDSSGSTIRESLYNLPVFNDIQMTNVRILRNGRVVTIPRIVLPRQRCQYVSSVISASSDSGSSITETVPPTALVTTTTTTAVTTTATAIIGG